MRASAPLLVALALVALGTAPAHAATEPEQVAEALREDPIYVAPELEGAITAGERRELEAAFAEADFPVYVALVPLFEGDAFDGDARTFLGVLQGRLDEPGVYVTSADGILTERGFGLEAQVEDRLLRAGSLANSEGDFDEPPAAVTLRLLDAIADPDLQARYDREQGRFGRGPDAPAPSEAGGDGGGTAWWPWAVVGLALIAVVGLALIAVVGLVVRRRGAHHRPDAPPVLPDRVFEHALAAAQSELREDAQRELVALADLLDGEEVPERPDAQERFQEALDAYGAARGTLDRARGIPDLAGVLVLVDRGRQAVAAATALSGGSTPRPASPVCVFHPLHGHADGRVAWARGLQVPACPDCARAVREGRTPETLRDGDRPYFEGDGVWARTGYGALADDLVDRVLRGERG